MSAAGAVVQSVSLATSFLEYQYASGYYHQAFNYRMAYVPLYSQSALLFHYLVSFAGGQPSPPLGTGFDRWFLFLHTAGVSWWPIAGLLGTALVVAGYAARHLVRLTRLVDSEQSAPNVVGSSPTT